MNKPLMTRALLGLFLISAFLIFGCSEDNPVTPDDGLATEFAVDGQEMEIHLESGLEVSIPEGVFSPGASISLTTAETPTLEAGPLPSSATPVSDVVRFEVDIEDLRSHPDSVAIGKVIEFALPITVDKSETIERTAFMRSVVSFGSGEPMVFYGGAAPSEAQPGEFS